MRRSIFKNANRASISNFPLVLGAGPKHNHSGTIASFSFFRQCSRHYASICDGVRSTRKFSGECLQTTRVRISPISNAK